MDIAGTDIGGTFTDLVGCIGGRIVTSKASTVPSDPAEGVAETLRLAACDMTALGEILHGSTIAINTVLERKGARTALITTKGFRDIYSIGRGNRSKPSICFSIARSHLSNAASLLKYPRGSTRGEMC